MFDFRCSFFLLLSSFLARCCPFIARYCTWKYQSMHLHMSEVDFAHIAVDERESRIHMFQWNANLTCPFVGSTCRDSTDNTLAPGIHNAIDYLVERSIPAVGDDEIITLSGSLGSKLHTLPPIGFQSNISVPPCCRQRSINISNFCQVFSISEIDHQACFLTLHEATPYASSLRTFTQYTS